MPTLNVHIKHAGKVHDLPLNTDAPAGVFKESVYQATGVPVERMKVMIKGGVLKDDPDWKKVAPKEGQTFMVVGAAGELPKPPTEPVVFLEDLDDTSLAQALALPVGLKNLGNTCYMNATLQTMRAIPELQIALSTYGGTSSGAQSGQGGHPILARALRDLYATMRSTTDAVTPMAFLSVLRQVVPQFGEMARAGKSSIPGMAGYAQQDAEECWVEISNALKALPSAANPSAEGTVPSGKGFVDQYMMCEIRRELKCDETEDEPAQVSTQKVLYLECNINVTTNYVHTGIADALNQSLTKNSPTLNREASYTAKLRLSRIPMNLTVLMVRFAWKREINKKAKIMRRVKFPPEFDILDLCTDELKQKLLPVNTKLKEFERDRAERRKVRRRTKIAAASSGDKTSAGAGSSDVTHATSDIEMTDASMGATSPIAGPESPVIPTGTGFASPTAAEKGKAPESAAVAAGAALEPESEYRARELAALEALVPAELREDVGCSVTGLYELVGIVAHKGAAADSGHYIGYVKKSAAYASRQAVSGGKAKEEAELDENDEDWYKFDDDKVSVFPADKLQTLEGGGEDASAYVLLYRSKALA